MKSRTCFLLAASAVAAAGLVGCARQTTAEAAVQTVQAGVAATIQPDTPERYSATIEPIAQVDLAFKSAGIVERILQVRGADGRMRDVQAGDKVEQGAVLALVRPLDYQQRVDQAAAQLAQAQAQVAQAQAQVQQTKASFSEAEIEYARATNLFQSASLVKPQFDQAKGRYEAGQASVAAAEAAVKGAEAGVARARAAMSEAQLSLSDTSVKAPFGGWVSARRVDVGSLVGSSAAGFTLMDTHLVKAVFAVPDSTLAAIHPGQKQAIVLDALQRAVPGVVTAIAPQADPKAHVFAIEVTLDNPREDVRPGMIGSLALGSTRDSRPRLVVPLTAVVRAPSNPQGFAVLCLRQSDGKTFASAQTIEVGETFGNSIEVTSGLTAGQRVIALGGELVHDGQQVRVLQ